MNYSPELPCTAFEELMLSQDTIAYPCNIFVRMKLVGQLNREYFTEAVRRMLEDHPMLRAKVKTRFGRSKWLIQELTNPRIDWQTGVLDFQNVPKESSIDLRSETGLHISVVESRQPTSVTSDGEPSTLVALKLHHAVADGLGFLSAIHDLWKVYDCLFRGNKIDLPLRNSNWLPLRNQFVPNLISYLQMVPKQFVGLAGVRQFLMRQPSAIAKQPVFRGTPLPEPVFESATYQLSKEMTEKLEREAKRRGISRNDLLAACIFRGCSMFQARCGNQSDDHWIRMMVPVNMRNAEKLQQLPACNIVSCVFLDRTPAQIREYDSLIRSVHEEMDLIKRKELALLFSLSLWIRKHTTFRSKELRINRCQTSIVFSNLGKVFDKSPLCDDRKRLNIGDMTLESIQAFAPLAPFMHAAFSTLIYGERLSILLRFDPRFIDQPDAQQLLQLITEDLERLFSEESVVT